MSKKKNLSSCNNSELISIICELNEIKAMRVTVNKCLSSGLMVGVAATLGGLLLGPRGIALGGIVAGVTASALNEGEFRSVPDILMNDLSEEQTRRLANSIRSLLSQENIMTVAALSMRMMSEAGFRETLRSVIEMFLKELNFSI
ncbi:protein C19orf12 homolog [Chelonus insularis]|uniref:protein C19orf12 homolog n=1 Tax=Chelonus insularis TaxID=460826 RepID=UPI00158DB74D|nr:protein C19orf12 homolog [Chelonus insularis]